MAKELIISIIIIVSIFIGNAVTENYTKESITETTQSLASLREEIIKDEKDIDNEVAKKKVYDIYEKWSLRHEKLA